MMICSQTGARPHENAIAALKKEKTFGIVFIRDGKYVTQANPDDEVLEDVFNHNRPYCICIKAYKNDRKITGCFNPFLICESGVDTVLWAKKIMYPVGNLLKHADTPDVLYSNLMWAPKPVLKLENGGKKSNLGPGINTQQRAVLMLFTNEYELEYAKWDFVKRRWIRDYNKEIARPWEYFNVFYIGKQGGWMIDPDALNIDWTKLPFGGTKQKTLGKIEKYINKFIEEEKQMAKRQPGFDYFDKEYYINEIQGAWVTLGIVRLLKSKCVKITRETMNIVLGHISKHRRSTMNPADTMDVYAIQHVEHIIYNLL